MTTPLALGTIGQISRTVRNIQEAQRWYGEVLGLRHLYTFGTLAFFDCDGVRLFLSEGAAVTDSILYFQVANIRAAYSELLGRGVEFVGAPHRIHRHADGTEEWLAVFRDNDGGQLALLSAVPPGVIVEG